MIKSKYDLKKAGFLDECDFFTRPLCFEELMGQKSGVWFDYNGERRVVRCGNFSGSEVVSGYLNKFGDSEFPELVRFDVDFVYSYDAVDGYDCDSMEENGANKKDIEALNNNKCCGAYYRLKLRYYRGCKPETKEYWFFAPEGWN